jgi:chaperonin GroES
MKDVKPMRDLMVVERFTKNEVTAGGILLPGQIMDTKTAMGKVLVVGDGAFSEKTGETVPTDVKVGDTVLFHTDSGIKVSGDRDPIQRFLLREEDILAMVDDNV